jgi:uncharacterized protein
MRATNRTAWKRRGMTRRCPGLVHQGQYSPMSDVVIAPSPVHGLGVFASRDFRTGETVLRIDDSRTVDDEHPLRTEAGEREVHCDYLAGGRVVLMLEPERHINSSCDPNAFVKTFDGVRHVLARRLIRAGEEITYDYIINCHGGDVYRCRCGSGRCRVTIVSSFFELPAALLSEYLPLLDDWFIAEHAEKIPQVRAATRDHHGAEPASPDLQSVSKNPGGDGFRPS